MEQANLEYAADDNSLSRKCSSIYRPYAQIDLFVGLSKYMRFRDRRDGSRAILKSTQYLDQKAMKSSLNFLRTLTGIKTPK